MRYTVTVGGETFKVEIGQGARVWVDHRPYDVDLQHVADPDQYSLLIDHRSYEIHVERMEKEGYQVVVAGHPYHARLRRGRRSKRSGSSEATVQEDASETEVCAPLAGLLVEMCVAEGERVDERDVVAVLDSMKMNLELRAPESGVVRVLRAAAGQEVAQGQVLAIIGSDGDLEG